jgi:PAS domain S-box-containing protein
MTGREGAGSSGSGSSREAELEAEIARLRAALAHAGLDADRLLAETTAAREERRQARYDTADAAARQARNMTAGSAELTDAEAPNTGMRQANDALEVGRAALTASEARLKSVFALKTVGLMFWGPGFGLTEVNDAFLAMTGFSREDALGKTWQELTPEEFHPASLRAVHEVTTQGESTPYEKQYFRKDGSRWWGLFAARKVGDEVMEFVLDVTAQRETQDALRDSEEQLRLIVENARDYAIFTSDPQDRITGWFAGAAAVFGWTAEEAVGQPGAMLYTPEDREQGVPEWENETARTHRTAPNVRWHLRKDGSRVFIEGGRTALRGADGQLRGFLKIGQDVTERRRTEEALRESEARFRHMADSAPALIWMTDADGQVTFANMHYDHMFGRPASEILGRGWEKIVLPEDLDRHSAAFLKAFQTRAVFKTETRVRDSEGEVRWLRCEGVPRLDDTGRFLGYTGCNVDITEARLAADELERRVVERTAELMAAEETLRQAQKMEAVGQLTGGIAHDFNNMLQGISGGLDLMQQRIAQGRAAEVERFLDVTRQTVERAAALTHRLLAFARRQTLDPKPVNADAMAQGMEELIRRTVGPGIQVELRLRDGSWAVQCDPNQLENVLLNLAINARDAMPEGGRLTIGTRHARLSAADVTHEEGAEPGEYVEVAVTDTGMGMDAATLARAFEPFFTTKPLGEGTGLGLSQLYGFVRQSHGIVQLDSKPGQGTTVRFYLPRHRQRSEAAGEADPGAAPGVLHASGASGGGTVLLVEDEAEVRAMAAEHLRDLGYTVLEAMDGPSALRILQDTRGSHLDLLLTDVGLPNGLNGRQVADAAREHRPGLPVLLITGYAGGALEGQLAPGMAVLSKPFRLGVLSTKVREMIDKR